MTDLEKKSHIFGSLFILANRVQILGDKVDPVLSIKQWLLIAAIPQFKSGSPTMSDIAKMIGSSRQNAKKMALILEKIGFVRLSKDENDARVIRIAPTTKCMEHFKLYEQAESDFIQKLFGGFSDVQLDGLYSGLITLESNVLVMEDEEDGNKNKDKEEK